METRYRYNDKEFSKVETQRVLRENIESLETVVDLCSPEWEALLSAYVPREITFMRVPFSHPLWILYSSGTTGNPKAITHSVGGNLLEHYKALALQQNVQEGDNFLWYTTTGWMMWNYALSALLCGATLCLYDGAIHHASHRTFWTFLQRAEVDHLGAGAAYYSSLHDFSIEGYAPKVIGSTGSPLPVATFENLQEKFPQTHIISLSGGTDVCSAFLSGSAMLPVYAGQLQCRALGAAIEALNDDGQAVYDEVGELVIEKPMPSMPIYFWNDKGNVKYHESYFEKFPRVWSHGDWIKIIRDEGIIIYGRSDATLNRGGVRIGTAEVYNAINGLEGIMDSLVICIEQVDGSSQMLLFVKLAVTQVLDETLRNKIKTQLRSTYSPRHVPDVICEVQDIPYTLSGKKLELPIKKLFMGHDIEKVVSKDVLRNPDCLHEYAQLRDRLKL
jgi:acetoacetyl-CoA synthetase